MWIPRIRAFRLGYRRRYVFHATLVQPRLCLRIVCDRPLARPPAIVARAGIHCGGARRNVCGSAGRNVAQVAPWPFLNWGGFRFTKKPNLLAPRCEYAWVVWSAGCAGLVKVRRPPRVRAATPSTARASAGKPASERASAAKNIRQAYRVREKQLNKAKQKTGERQSVGV